MSGTDKVSEEEEKLRAVQRQLSTLVRESDQQRAEISRLREQLEQQEREQLKERAEQLKEREYVVAQLNRIARSGTWRWGHRLATLRWRITRRPVRNSDAVTQLLERIGTPQLPAPQDHGHLNEGDGRVGGNGDAGTGERESDVAEEH